MLSFILVGLATGAVYGMSGVGLVLTYRTSNVFNFAYGAIGTLAAYVFYSLHVNDGIAWPLAALVAVVGVGVIVGLFFAVLSKPLSTAALTTQIAATVGVMLIIEAGCTIIYGTNTLNFPSFLSTRSVHILGTDIGESQIVIFAVATVLTVALSFVLRRTRAGLSMRAVVAGSTLMSLSGGRPNAVRALAWIIGTGFAAIAGLLVAPSISLNPEILTLLVVQAYAAAALGLFKNIGWTYAGGLLIGVLVSVCTYLGTSSAFLKDLAPGLPFVILLIVLFVLPRGKLPRPRLVAEAVRRPAGLKLHASLAIPLLVALIFAPQFAAARLATYAGALAFVILFLSLGLLVKESGQVSLAHVGFAAVGAAALGHFTGGGMPWGLGLLLAGLVAVPFGALLAIPAIRHGGLYLALATFGFGLVLQETFYAKSYMLGQSSVGLTVPLPGGGVLLTNGDYYLILGLAVVVSAVVALLLSGRLGRLLSAFAQSPVALLSSGLDTTALQVSLFCFSAFLAGIAGALYGSTLGIVAGTAFDPFQSLIYLALIVIVVGRAPWYGWVAGLFLVLVPSYISGANTTNYLDIMFGVFAILTAFTPALAESAGVRRLAGALAGLRAALPRPGGGAGGAAAAITPALHVVPAAEAAASDGAAPAASSTPGAATAAQASGGSREALELRDVTVRFGGLIAAEKVTLRAKRGEITALIGPNGAGKTTTFNATSGLIRASSGTVRLNGKDVTRVGPSRRARLGLGRTFQELNLFDGMPVFENIAVVADAQDAGALPWRQMLPRWRTRRAVAAQVRETARVCGLEAVLQHPAGTLSTAQRRMVDLARALMASPDLLLLDEPLSGLDVAEGDALMQLLRRLCAERDTAILVVEHDMDFVARVADYVYVLDFGRQIFEGNAASVLDSEVVREAYIGSSAAAEIPETA